MDQLRNFGFLIRDVSRLFAKSFERHAADLNLTLAECNVLGHLSRNEGISQARLAEITDTVPMTLLRILDRMEGEGLIERRADPQDRRARQLFLGKAAMPVLQEMWRIGDSTRSDSFVGLTPTESNSLIKLLGRVHANLNGVSSPAAEPRRLSMRPMDTAPHKQVVEVKKSPRVGRSTYKKS